MKVKVIKEIPSLSPILPLGFETELIVKTTAEKKLLSGGRPIYNRKTKTIETPPEVFAPIGNYEGFTFVGLDGEIYDDSLLFPFKLEKIFEKI